VKSNLWYPTASLEVLQQRDALLQALREYFKATGSLEVHTPILSAAATTDPHIESYRSSGSEGELWLHTSPEFPMKRLIAAYAVDMHQFATVFRQEEIGRYHNREFQLLEWYRMNIELEELIEDAIKIVHIACTALQQTCLPVSRVSYQEAVYQLCGEYPHELSVERIANYFKKCQRSFPDSLLEHNHIAALDDALVLLMDEFIIANFAGDRLTVLTEYPASQASLAKTITNKAGIPIALRAELFVGSVELANGFYELTDADEQGNRFSADNNERLAKNLTAMPHDENLLSAMQNGLPNCAGMALGVDRLIMALLRLNHMEDVISFPAARA